MILRLIQHITKVNQQFQNNLLEYKKALSIYDFYIKNVYINKLSQIVKNTATLFIEQSK